MKENQKCCFDDYYYLFLFHKIKYISDFLINCKFLDFYIDFIFN